MVGPGPRRSWGAGAAGCRRTNALAVAVDSRIYQELRDTPVPCDGTGMRPLTGSARVGFHVHDRDARGAPRDCNGRCGALPDTAKTV